MPSTEEIPIPLPTLRHQRGVSLIECCVVAAIAAVGVGAVAPNFDRMIPRRHLEGTAA